jgi:hypothetical protein
VKNIGCSACKSQQKRNEFVMPGSCNFKTSAFAKHEASADHRAAQAAVESRVGPAGAIHEAAAYQAAEAETRMLHNMALAYWLAQKLLAHMKMGSLCRLFEERG